MARCPAGHESQASDYCDTCGLVIGGEAAAVPSAIPAAPPVAAAVATSGAASSSGGSPAGAGANATAAGAHCPVCQAERNGRFCEECGYDFDLAEAMPQATLTPGIAPASQESPAAGKGLDLDAELARAEAAAGSAGSAGAAESAASAGSAAYAGSGNGAGAGSGTESLFTPASATASASAPGATAVEPEAAADPSADPSAELSSASSAEASSAPVREQEAESEPDPVYSYSSSSSSAPLPLSSASSAGTLAALSAGVHGLAGEELALVVDADRDYYAAQIERGDIIESEFPFPKYPHERRFTFVDGPVRIGRASASRGLNPEIDLTGPPLDPAVSHLHAQLLRHDEGWVVVDLGSANGTRLNDAEEPLEAETEIPVKQGDRIHLGVWTTITVQ